MKMKDVLNEEKKNYSGLTTSQLDWELKERLKDYHLFLLPKQPEHLEEFGIKRKIDAVKAIMDEIHALVKEYEHRKEKIT